MMGQTRSASAVWNGTLKEGDGVVSAQSGAFEQLAYSFRTRFENEPGTNPEELVAAAHAGCYAMALSAALSAAGMQPERIEARADVTLETVDDKPTVSRSVLTVTVAATGGSVEDIMRVAQETKSGCPISRLLNAEIGLNVSIAS